MKLQVTLSWSLLGAAFTALSTALHIDSIQPPPAYPIGQVRASNARVVGRVFEIDGKVEYFAGSNAWWLAHLSKNSDIDIALSEVAKTKYKVLRVWGFGDVNTIPDPSNQDANRVYFQILNSTGSYINFGADGLQRLDYTVSSAERHSVKLVLNFVNNWSDYGGIAAYTTAFGANSTEWFTDEISQKVYRNYINVLVNRYKASSAIFAWELANEPRCNGCATSVLTQWASNTSQYIKSLDGGHLVTLGDEGWFAPAESSLVVGYDGSYAYSGSEGVDWIANLQVPTLDYGTFHLYPDSWGYNYSWGNEWILQHDAVGERIGKPVILEEYGAPYPGNHTPYYKPWQDTVLRSGVAADQVWQFGTYDLSVPASNLGDVNSIYFNDTEYKILGFQHAAAMLEKEVES
ncbi:hypothetical protein VPNG_06781 [Cytospora leucostoma]|uniref:Mannan endo-1,4-beta-mannosidase A n=1 Tax=Cytospora leucostoma TaxID=1230097 RepID=A0A423WVR1_9PEZI|nr:hypothetical protein VPNG_06781 [Cytospora leucostoma]